MSIAMSTEQVLQKGADLTERIRVLGSVTQAQGQKPTVIHLSFDLFCLLAEYSLLVSQLHLGESQDLSELFLEDQLFFEMGDHQLQLMVDYFEAPNTVFVS
jgi:hypothetical protein